MASPANAVDAIAYSDRSEKWVPITVVPSSEYGSYVLTGDERDGRPVAERDPDGTHRVLEFSELVSGGYRDDVPPPDENGDWPEGVPVPPLPDTQLEPGIQAYGDTLPGYTWIDNPRSGGGAYATEGPSCILLHMTVSMGLSASYVSQHPYPPHCWANPYTGDKWQTVSLDRAAYALYQPASSRCWTNREGYTIQTELVGVPVVNEETYNDGHLRWIAENVVVPQAQWLASIGQPVDLTNVAYRSDSSGSASEYWGGRMSEDEWENFNGLCQHSVIPYNDHWDCSVERLDLIAQYAREIMGQATPPPSAPPPFPLEVLDMMIGQDQSNGRLYIISGNTKLELPYGGGQPGSPGGGNIYADEWLRMVHQAWPQAGWGALVALNPDIVNRIPNAYDTVDGSANPATRTAPGEEADPSALSG